MKSDLVLFINIHTHTRAETEQNARKLPWQEQMLKEFNHSPLEYTLFSPKTKVNFILSDANGNTAQKLSMNSQFHRNLKLPRQFSLLGS